MPGLGFPQFPRPRTDQDSWFVANSWFVHIFYFTSKLLTLGMLMKGDRVKRVGPKKNQNLGMEGVVQDVSCDGRKVQVNAADGTRWNMQSVDNFERLFAAPSEPAPVGPSHAEKLGGPASPSHPPPVAPAAAPAAPNPGQAAAARDCAEYDASFVGSLGYNPAVWVIPSMNYISGKDRDVLSVPFDLESGAWYVDKGACFPPEFTEVSVKALARAEGDDTVRWGRQTYTLQEWQHKLADWQKAYPNITRSDGSAPHETASYRTTQTTSPEIIKKCFDKCKRPTWPANLSGPSRTLLDQFRVDMWGNMICLPASAGGLAQNDALCFFDVDHTFPFSRGGRSVLKNFEAMQCCANRYVKSDRLVQTLDPRAMHCGISAAQLLALVQWADSAEKVKDTKKLRKQIEVWLTGSPRHGQSFCAFQKDVKQSTDSAVLRTYFARIDAAFYQDIVGVDLFPGSDPPPATAAAEGAPALTHLPPHQGPPPTAALAGAVKAPPTTPPHAAAAAADGARTPDAAPLKMRVVGGLLEVWGSYTFAVKEGLKELKFRWDGDDGRRCWWRIVQGEREEVEELQSKVQQLASAHGFACTLAS